MISVQELEALLLKNVVDVRFVRRRPLKHRAPTRRMLCTKSYDLLGSTNGRIVLNYKPPKHGHQFNEAKLNACVVWDILMQDYRILPAENAQVVNVIPADDTFWKYFNEEIYILTTEQKIEFMES